MPQVYSNSEESFGSYVWITLSAAVIIMVPATVCLWSRRPKRNPSTELLLGRSSPFSALGSCAIVVLIILGWTLLVLLGLCLIDHGRPNSFDPYKILDLPPSSSQEEIRKAYHDLSKVLHPDVRGTGDKEEFMLITTAYRSLINGPGKRNYQLFGNPDGVGFETPGVPQSNTLAEFFKWAEQRVNSFDQWLRIKLSEI